MKSIEFFFLKKISNIFLKFHFVTLFFSIHHTTTKIVNHLYHFPIKQTPNTHDAHTLIIKFFIFLFEILQPQSDNEDNLKVSMSKTEHIFGTKLSSSPVSLNSFKLGWTKLLTIISSSFNHHHRHYHHLYHDHLHHFCCRQNGQNKADEEESF